MNGKLEDYTASVSLDFLEKGKMYKIESWTDGKKIDSCEYSTLEINGGSTLEIRMARTGGAVYRIIEQ